MLAILKKELKTYYSSLFSYIYYMIFFLVAGVLFSKYCLEYYSTQFGFFVLRYCIFVVVVMLPICTMRIFSQERKLKTDQLLFTAPVSTLSILVGKYIATAIFVLVPVLLSGIYPCVISSYGTMSGDFLACSYIGGILLVFALLSIGMFISTLTSNAVLSAVITYVIYMIIILLRVLEGIINPESGLYTFIHEISLYNKYYDMVSGIIRSGDIIYFIVIAITFFLLTWISLLNRRQKDRITIGSCAAVLLCGMVCSYLCLNYTKVYDYTPAKILSLSEETKDRVSQIDEATCIFYMGNKSQANATYVELLSAYENLSDNIIVEYIPLENKEFHDAFLADLPSVKEASIVVATGDRYVYLDSDDYVTVTQTGQYTYERMLEIENQITSAILYTNASELKNIITTSGHGEKTLGSGYCNVLKTGFYEIKSIDLTEESRDISSTVLLDAAALLIYAPSEDFSDEDVDQLERFVEEGGILLVSVDPLNEDLENLFGFLKEYGLSLQQGVLIDDTEGYHVLNTEYYLSPHMKETEYTKDIVKKNLGVITYTSKGIALYGKGNGFETTDILVTSENAFSKMDDFDNMTTKGENDLPGPFSIASVATAKEKGSIFLIASDIFLNETANDESGGANSRFFVEMIKSLSGDNGAVWIEGKDVNSETAHYPTKMIAASKIISMIVIPLCILVLGVLLLLGRKKNIGWKIISKYRQSKERETEDTEVLEVAKEDTAKESEKEE